MVYYPRMQIIFGLVVAVAVISSVYYIGKVRGISVGYARSMFDEAEVGDELRESAQAAIQARIKKRLDRIVAVVKHEGKITNDGVEDLFCIGDRTASRYLRFLVKEGRLVREGSGRGTFYTLPKNK